MEVRNEDETRRDEANHSSARATSETAYSKELGTEREQDVLEDPSRSPGHTRLGSRVHEFGDAVHGLGDRFGVVPRDVLVDGVSEDQPRRFPEPARHARDLSLQSLRDRWCRFHSVSTAHRQVRACRACWFGGPTRPRANAEARRRRRPEAAA